MFTPLLGAQNPLSKVSTSQNSVCPLSDSQTQKSIEAFAKIVPTFTQEPRCVNCHGGVDPFSDTVAGNHSDPNAPRSEHGGGKQDRPTDPDPSKASCPTCHDNMLPRRNGSPSVWQMALPQHFFIGKDAPMLCKQMKDVFKEAADFIGHLTDDNGNSNFTGTAFMGTRGLDEIDQKKIPPQPPLHITHGGLVQLGKDWVAAMGGEFKGDVECGCEPEHYDVRVTQVTEINMPMAHYVNAMKPVDIPITFKDDGSFQGEGRAQYQGAGAAMMCSGQSTSSISLKASGKDIQQFQKNSFHLDMENTSSMDVNATATCPYVGTRGMHNDGNTRHAELNFDMKGTVGEVTDYMVPGSSPQMKSMIRIELVKEPK